jgi:serine/threonine protein kinase
MHAKDIMHRDLKLDNVVFGKSSKNLINNYILS